MTRLVLSPHALERARQMNVTHADITSAVAHANRTWPDRGRTVHCDGKLLVVLSEDGVVVTVSWDTPGKKFQDRATGS